MLFDSLNKVHSDKYQYVLKYLYQLAQLLLNASVSAPRSDLRQVKLHICWTEKCSEMFACLGLVSWFRLQTRSEMYHHFLTPAIHGYIHLFFFVQIASPCSSIFSSDLVSKLLDSVRIIQSIPFSISKCVHYSAIFSQNLQFLQELSQQLLRRPQGLRQALRP